MAIIELNKTVNGTIGIWEITEPATVLLHEAEAAGIAVKQAQAYRSDIRKSQWAAIRLMLKKFPGMESAEIFYDEFGKPHLNNSACHISISHSRQMVSMITDTVHPTGIDLEHFSQKVITIKNKFLSDNELDTIDPQCEEEHLMTYWCAKEALYKAYGKKKLIFREQILIHPFPYRGSGLINGTIIVPGALQEFSMRYEKKGDYMLVYLLNN